MNSIHDCDRLERLERALLVLEGLTFLQEDDAEDSFSSLVYQIAHTALGFCGAKDHHDKAWLDIIPYLENKLKEAKLINVERIINERIRSSSEHKKDS